MQARLWSSSMERAAASGARHSCRAVDQTVCPTFVSCALHKHVLHAYQQDGIVVNPRHVRRRSNVTARTWQSMHAPGQACQRIAFTTSEGSTLPCRCTLVLLLLLTLHHTERQAIAEADALLSDAHVVATGTQRRHSERR